MDDQQCAMNRRRFLACLSAAGLGSALMPGALAAVAQDAETITLEMIEAAQAIAGLSFTRDEQQRIVERLNGAHSPLPAFDTLRTANLGNDTQLAIVFNPVPPGKALPSDRRPLKRRELEVVMPATDEDLAFLPVTNLAKLVENRQIKPSELTKLYLARLKQYDPRLHVVVTLTEELALRQAQRADDEIAAGTYRGPLHGIPWGAKDLLAARGTKTTWGMSPYADRTIDLDSTVFSKLSEAGAILIAKLSTGALAVSARWFGGLTRNPWNTEQDASGSSAGPGSATAAGLVGFSIGTDTGGSIILPSTRNGVTGLRPTFGRVSRYGAMGPGLDSGHDRPYVSLSRGLRSRAQYDLRTRREGQHVARRAVQLGRNGRRNQAARRLSACRFRRRDSGKPGRSRERYASTPDPSEQRKSVAGDSLTWCRGGTVRSSRGAHRSGRLHAVCGNGCGLR